MVNEETNEVFAFAHGWLGEQGTAASTSSPMYPGTGERALAFVLERESTPFFEMMGFVYWLRTYAPRCRCKRVRLSTDGEAADLALKKGFSPIPNIMSALTEARTITADNFIVLQSNSIPGDLFNEAADHLSKNRMDERIRCLRDLYGDHVAIRFERV